MGAWATTSNVAIEVMSLLATTSGHLANLSGERYAGGYSGPAPDLHLSGVIFSRDWTAYVDNQRAGMEQSHDTEAYCGRTGDRSAFRGSIPSPIRPGGTRSAAT